MKKNDIESQSVTVVGERSRTVVGERSRTEPYELPAGWKWVRLGDVADTVTGNTPSKKNPKFYGNDFPFFKPADLEQKDSLFNASEYLSEQGKEYARFIPAYSTYICCIGSIGKSAYSVRDGCSNQQINSAIPHKNIDSKYLYYSVNTENFINQLWSKASSTTISIVNKSKMDSCIIPLPPTLAEQQRIVSRIESMFTKLDEAKDRAQSVLDGFELRRAAVLHKAFTGQLKIDNEELTIDDWEEKKLEDVLIEKPRNGYSTTAVDYETPYKTMSLSATTSGYFRPEFYKYIEADISDDSFLWLKPGDILIQRANSLDKVGTSAIYTGDEHEFIYPDLMMKLQVKESVSTKFIAYQLKTEKSMAYFRSNATGTAGNMPKINQKTVCNLPIKLPPLNYQLSIVNFLDTVLEKESRAKEAAGAVLDQIALLKKSILARAFRGKL